MKTTRIIVNPIRSEIQPTARPKGTTMKYLCNPMVISKIVGGDSAGRGELRSSETSVVIRYYALEEFKR